MKERRPKPNQTTQPIHHIAIFFDDCSGVLYAVPGTTIAGRGDKIVVHAINRRIELWLARVSKKKTKIEKRGKKPFPIPVATRPGIYHYRAYSPDDRLYAIGGSYPKVIIYD